MFFIQISKNEAFISGLIGLLLAQVLKPFVNYFINREWDWFLSFQSGGMPSSHSSMVTAIATSIGIWKGFDTSAFALAAGVSAIVTYDAANVRWQSGLHARRINQIFRDVFSGQPLDDDLLKEVIGHTPRQVYAGVLLGILIALLVHWFMAG